ncbi:hypothetical protein PGO02_02585 [Klebsiella aerogenes]|nr:hypothetical protein [Klebsiella aerogenes]
MFDIKDLISSFKDTVLSPLKGAIEYRAKNNFFGSFLLAWLIWNWEKIAYFIFSGDAIILKLNNISSNDFLSHAPDWYMSFFKISFLLPLGVAVFFSLGYPYFTLGISLIQKKILNSTYNFNVDVEHSRLEKKKIALRDAVELDSVKAIQQSDTDRIIAENNEKKAQSELNLKELRIEYADKSVSLKNTKADLAILEETIKQQLTRKQNLTNEIATLNEELSPLRHEQDRINELSKQIVTLQNNIGNLSATLESKEFEIRRQEKMFSSQLESYRQLKEKNQGLLEHVKMVNNLLVPAVDIMERDDTYYKSVINNVRNARDATYGMSVVGYSVIEQ